MNIEELRDRMYEENHAIVNLSDMDLFGNEAGEDEDKNILASYFLDVPDSELFFDKNNRLCIVSARKGVGKSALLSLLEYKLNSTDDNIVIKTTGNELLGLGDFLNKDSLYLENYWKQIILKKINIEIGKKINLPLNSKELFFVKNAEIEGLRNKPLIRSLLDRMKIGLNAGIISLSIESNKEKNDEFHNGIEQINNFLKNKGDSTIWFLVDDVDSKFHNNLASKERVSSFFSALRNLSNTLTGINFRSTVRTDVWTTLRDIEDFDKLEQYIFEIRWSNIDMRRILSKRIKSYLSRHCPKSREASLDIDDYENFFDLVFQKTIKWGGKERPFYEPILIYSNKRPRWMIQLSNMASKDATRRGFNKIKETNLLNVLEKFGVYRVSDLEKEYSHQFQYITKLIDIFRKGKRTYNKSELENLIKNKFLTRYKVDQIDGENFIDSEQLGKFLYRIGFITGTTKDKRNQNQFRSFEDDPDLYDSHLNLENKIIWSIHPSYRKYLYIR